MFTIHKHMHTLAKREQPSTDQQTNAQAHKQAHLTNTNGRYMYTENQSHMDPSVTTVSVGHYSLSLAIVE